MPGKKVAHQTFEVIYTPDGSGWHASIPKVKGCHTWGRSLTEARRNIREALSTCADVFADPDAVARAAVFTETKKLSSFGEKALLAYEAKKADQAEASRQAEAASRAAARALIVREGVSLRDAGELLGLSGERVRKLAADPTRSRAVNRASKDKRRPVHV